MRNPFKTEADAFRFLWLTIAYFAVIVLAAWINTWLGVGVFAALTRGLGAPIPVSAAQGLGTGDLLDRIVELLPEGEDEPDGDTVRLAIIGLVRDDVGGMLPSLAGRTDVQLVGIVDHVQADVGLHCPHELNQRLSGKPVRS